MKKGNLYIVPIMDANMQIEIENDKFISLMDYSFINYPTLYNLQKKRLLAIQSSTLNSIHYKAKIEQFAKEEGIPLYLIAFGNDCEVREIITKKRIISDYPAALGVKRQINKDKFDILYHNSYSKKVLNFLNFEIEEKEKIKVKY